MSRCTVMTRCRAISVSPSSHWPSHAILNDAVGEFINQQAVPAMQELAREKRRFGVVVLPYGRLREVAMAYRYNALTGKGQQRERAPAAKAPRKGREQPGKRGSSRDKTWRWRPG